MIRPKNHYRMKKIIYIMMSLLIPMMVEAKIVSGRVTDASGEGIISATIVIKGTTVGTVTDVDGNYVIDAPEGAVLVFSYLGMQTQEMPVTTDIHSVVLKEDNKVLDEVVVTG